MEQQVKPISETLMREQHSEFLDLYTRILAATHESAAGYLNVVTLAGYAAFFGVWSLIGDDLTAGQKRWSALLLTVSVLFFVGFELAKACFLQWNMRALLKASDAPFDSQLEELRNREQAWLNTRRNIAKSAARIWIVLFPISVATGAGAGFVLIYALIQKIWHG